nr:hypothetical protein [Gluconobacter oxydans]
MKARHTRKLFPNQRVYLENSSKAKLAEQVDLVTGNPPFSNSTMRGTDELGHPALFLHENFIALPVSRLRPRAMGLLLTSRWSMEKRVVRAGIYLRGKPDAEPPDESAWRNVCSGYGSDVAAPENRNRMWVGGRLPTFVRVKGETMILVIVGDRKWFTKILRKTKKTLQAVATALKSLSE